MVGINSRQTLASTSTIPRSNGLGFIPFDLMVLIRSSSSSVHCRPSFIRLHLRSLPTARLHPLTFIRSPSFPVQCRPMLSFGHSSLSPDVIRPFVVVSCCHSYTSLHFCVIRLFSMSFLCFYIFRLEPIHTNWFKNTKSNWEGSTYTSVVTSSRYPPTDYSCFYH
jgi:hypothetical protein